MEEGKRDSENNILQKLLSWDIMGKITFRSSSTHYSLYRRVLPLSSLKKITSSSFVINSCNQLNCTVKNDLNYLFKISIKWYLSNFPFNYKTPLAHSPLGCYFSLKSNQILWLWWQGGKKEWNFKTRKLPNNSDALTVKISKFWKQEQKWT